MKTKSSIPKPTGLALRSHSFAVRAIEPGDDMGVKRLDTIRAAKERAAMRKRGERADFVSLQIGDADAVESIATLAVALGNGWNGWPRTFAREAAGIVALAREIRDAKRTRSRAPNPIQRLAGLSRRYCFSVRKGNRKGVLFGLDLHGGDGCRVEFVAA